MRFCYRGYALAVSCATLEWVACPQLHHCSMTSRKEAESCFPILGEFDVNDAQRMFGWTEGCEKILGSG